MKLGIIGGGLTSLSLAKSLVNQGMIVDLFYTEPKSYFNKGRTIGVSKENLDFFNKNILDIKKTAYFEFVASKHRKRAQLLILMINQMSVGKNT